jgi:hypothetical protein
MVEAKSTSESRPLGPLEPLSPDADSRVAIGIPVRNGAEFLELALQTITRQTHSNLEIVISDNASTDGTAEICQRFARDDSRIRYLRQPVALPANEHIRFVFEQCESQWFMWASHDDLRDDNYVEVLLSGFAARPGAALAVTNTEIISDHFGRTPGTALASPMGSTAGMSFGDRHSTVVNNGAVQIYGLFRSDVLRSFRWPKLPAGHDWMILHWAATFGDIMYVPGSTFRYFMPAVPRSARELHAYHWLKGRSWLDTIQLLSNVKGLPDVRWALQASRELQYARRAQGLSTSRWEMFPGLCFLHQGGPKIWAKRFVYWNAPTPVRSAWTALKRGPTA